MTKRPAALLASVIALALSGCGGSDDDSPAAVQASPKATVVLTAAAYHPPRVRIKVGNRVTFVNRVVQPNTAETEGVGFFEYDRRVHDRKNVFDVHTLQQGEAESVEFDTPGVYRYFSSLDNEMRGVIEVIEPR
jgi:plastocyanin